MDSGRENPCSPAAPKPFPTAPLQKDSVGGRLEAARGVLPVSDRAAGLGWRRPLPREGELGADCAQDKPLEQQQLGRAARAERSSGLADKTLVRKNAGRQWSPLGRALATGTRLHWWRWPPSGRVQTADGASATARPPGRATWGKDLEDCCGERPRWETMDGQLYASCSPWLTCGNVCASLQGTGHRGSSTEEEKRHDSKHDMQSREGHYRHPGCWSEPGLFGELGLEEGNLRCVKCPRRKSLLCLWSIRPVSRLGAGLARCVKSHCGDPGLLGVPRKSEGDLRCVKCNRRESLLCRWSTWTVSRLGAVLARCVENHCGWTGLLGVPRQSEGDLRCVKCHRRKFLHCLRLTKSVQLTMSDGGRPRAWARAAAERAAREKLTTMPGGREAQARAENRVTSAKIADKARAETIAQSEEAQKVQEAQAVRKIQKNLKLLSMNDMWSLKAQTWSVDQKMLDNRMTCAHHADKKSVLFLEPGARRQGPGVDGSDPGAEVASVRDFSAEGQLRAARGVRPGARRRGPRVEGSEPGVEGCEVGAQEQLASWEAVVNEKHEAALRGVRCSYKQYVFSLEPNGGDAWQGAAADTTAWKCQGVCVPRPVPRQGAVSLRCVKCHCGETGFVGMPGQIAGDLRCVKPPSKISTLPAADKISTEARCGLSTVCEVPLWRDWFFEGAQTECR